MTGYFQYWLWWGTCGFIFMISQPSITMSQTKVFQVPTFQQLILFPEDYAGQEITLPKVQIGPFKRISVWSYRSASGVDAMSFGMINLLDEWVWAGTPVLVDQELGKQLVPYNRAAAEVTIQIVPVLTIWTRINPLKSEAWDWRWYVKRVTIARQVFEPKKETEIFVLIQQDLQEWKIRHATWKREHQPEQETSPPNEPQDPQQGEKFSDFMKQLHSEVKSPSFQSDSPLPSIPSEQASLSQPPTSLKQELDQQLTKLTIPNVAPAEFSPERLQGENRHLSMVENRYLRMVENTIDQHWRAYSNGSTNDRTVVTFRIDKSGEISSVTLQESSGEAKFDASALQAIQMANPLPPFPENLTKDFIKVSYHFIYQR